MTDDLVKRLQDYLDCRPWAAGRTFDPTHPECLIAQAKDRIEQLEAALFSIYVAPNDQPFIKSQIESVLDVNECRQKWVGEK